MKILFYDFNIPKIIYEKETNGGGSSIQTYHWINGLKKNNINVCVLIDGKSKYPLRHDGINFIKTFSLNKASHLLIGLYTEFLF